MYRSVQSLNIPGCVVLYADPTNIQDRSRSPVSFQTRRDYQAPKEGEVNEDKQDAREEEDLFNKGDRVDRRDDRKADRRGGFRRDREDRGRSSGGASDVDRNYERSIFVGNVPYESTAQDIKDIFSRDFNIVRADIVMVRGRSRGMATVELESLADVESAISKFDRTQLSGREIFVRRDRPPPAERKRAEESREEGRGENRERGNERRSENRTRRSDGASGGTEVFISNLPYSTSWQNLKDMMRSVGSVQRADVLSTKWGGSKGLGTVVFDTLDQAQAAIEKFNGYNLEGRRLELRLGRGTSEKPRPAKAANSNTPFTEGVLGDGEPSSQIYVDNLPYITAQSDLFELFETIGRVSKAEIQYNQDGRPNGTAVVEFETEHMAELSIKNLDGYNYGGRRLRISYAARPASTNAEPMDADEPQESAENPGHNDNDGSNQVAGSVDSGV